MELEGAPAESAGTEPLADSESRRSLARRLLGLGLGGAAVALVPIVSGRAAASSPPGTGEQTPEGTSASGGTPTSVGAPGANNVSPESSPGTAGSNTSTTAAVAPTTTALPKRPTDADVQLLVFSQQVEIAAYQLYRKSLDLPFSDDQRPSSRSSASRTCPMHKGCRASSAARRATTIDEALVLERTPAFTRDVSSMLQAAYDLESTLVATNVSIIAQLVGTDAVNLLASIVTVEGRNGTVFADLMGSTDLSVLLVDNEADALTPAKG